MPDDASCLLSELSRRIATLDISDDDRSAMGELIAETHVAIQREVTAEADRQFKHLERLQERLHREGTALRQIASGRWNVGVEVPRSATDYARSVLRGPVGRPKRSDKEPDHAP